MGGSSVLKLAEVTTVVPVSKQMTTSDPLVWIDCEMTGLDQSADALIEVAVVVTDYELKPLAEGIDVLIKPPAAALEQISEAATDDAPTTPPRDAEPPALPGDRRGGACA